MTQRKREKENRRAFPLTLFSFSLFLFFSV